MFVFIMRNITTYQFILQFFSLPQNTKQLFPGLNLKFSSVPQMIIKKTGTVSSWAALVFHGHIQVPQIFSLKRLMSLLKNIYIIRLFFAIIQHADIPSNTFHKKRLIKKLFINSPSMIDSPAAVAIAFAVFNQRVTW
jgi:hypothetical protein